MDLSWTNPFDDPEFGDTQALTVQQVAKALQLTDKAVTSRARAHELPGAQKLSGAQGKGHWRFNREMLRRWYDADMQASLDAFNKRQSVNSG